MNFFALCFFSICWLLCTLSYAFCNLYLQIGCEYSTLLIAECKVDHLPQQKGAPYCPLQGGILNYRIYGYAHRQGDNQPQFLLPFLDVFLINKFKSSFNDFIRRIGDLPRKNGINPTVKMPRSLKRG